MLGSSLSVRKAATRCRSSVRVLSAAASAATRLTTTWASRILTSGSSSRAMRLARMSTEMSFREWGRGEPGPYGALGAMVGAGQELGLDGLVGPDDADGGLGDGGGGGDGAGEDAEGGLLLALCGSGDEREVG